LIVAAPSRRVRIDRLGCLEGAGRFIVAVQARESSRSSKLSSGLFADRVGFENFGDVRDKFDTIGRPHGCID
jgi:hypothetical protein